MSEPDLVYAIILPKSRALSDDETPVEKLQRILSTHVEDYQNKWIAWQRNSKVYFVVRTSVRVRGIIAMEIGRDAVIQPPSASTLKLSSNRNVWMKPKRGSDDMPTHQIAEDTIRKWIEEIWEHDSGVIDSPLANSAPDKILDFNKRRRRSESVRSRRLDTEITTKKPELQSILSSIAQEIGGESIVIGTMNLEDGDT